MRLPARLGVLVSICALGCGPAVADPGDTDGGTGPDPETSSAGPGPTPNDSAVSPMSTSASGTSPTDPTDPSGTDDTTTGVPTAVMLDVLVVVDNSSDMGSAQARLAASGDALVDLLRVGADDLDVNVMVTTTDMGNPLCDAFAPDGYEPARGAPVSTPCSDRIDDFTSNTVAVPEACTNACPTPVAPDGAFVHFTADDNNVPDGTAAQALACLLPQGIIGCGYESPLESMLQALSPEACWNQGGGCDGASDPFLRADAQLAVVLVTSELDCSISSPAVMNDSSLFNTNPDNGAMQASSALCFNAGARCDGPDASGNLANCVAADDDNLFPPSRYTAFFDALGKPVTVVPIVGVAPPGEGATEYRRWRDPQYPEGDVLPDPWGNGVRAEDLEFSFGLGPGCTSPGLPPTHFVQALPPVRVAEVCADATGCCLSSLCADDYDDAFGCLADAAAAGS